MNLLCPNCQKMLTVPEQFAGQLMKCPLCNGTFTVPNLPAAPPGAAAPSFGSFTKPPQEEDTFGIGSAPPPAPPPPAPPPPPSAPPEPPPAGYTRTLSLPIPERVITWVAPACILLVFVLLFFPWVMAYDGKAWFSQLGWGTGFGHEGWWVGILYILLLFPGLLLAVAAAVVGLLPLKLPPNLVNLLPWRAAVVLGVLLLSFLLLVLQYAAGFGLEKFVQTAPPKESKSEDPLEKQLKDPINLTFAQVSVQRTAWVKLVLLLHLLALVGAGLDLCLLLRGSNRPSPRVDLLW
ncbi:MAG TPA: hypothetical protein VFA26_16870 [Gemmataceae bacterium]|nr:hypothetical protein [Gemmataceae bacterium]